MNALPDWEKILSAACRLQQLLPDAVLVGGTAAALHASHRKSHDADHVVLDLRQRFDDVLAALESVAGWKTARVQRPVLILGSLDGIETGIRQLRRVAPLDTTTIDVDGGTITLPTEAEMLRIKAWLVLTRNATRDYIDLAAMTTKLGIGAATQALQTLDSLYPQDHGQSALQQLMKQLADPQPYDLAATDLAEYHELRSDLCDWSSIVNIFAHLNIALLDSSSGD